MMMFLSLVQMDERFGGSPPGWALAIDDLFEPFHIVSPYGLFSVMTTTRDEIIVEGSDDGVQWREYEFRYKPGDLMRRPPWNIPHQPRLDWQMWFAALDDPQRVPWFSRFLERLLENEPSVTGLLKTNPFPDKPPTYVRAELYEYSYAGKDQAAGQWWNRRLAGLYFPRARLKTQGE
jgi:lipase maturation factor 1